MSPRMKIASKNYYSCLKISFWVPEGSHRSQAPKRLLYKFQFTWKIVYPKELSWSPFKNHIFSGFCEFSFHLLQTTLSHCHHCIFLLFLSLLVFLFESFDQGEPRTTLFLSPNTPKAKFSLITALGNFPDKQPVVTPSFYSWAEIVPEKGI